MSVRLASVLIVAAISAFAVDFGLSMHQLRGAQAAVTNHAWAIHTQSKCPTAALSWCRAAGGLAE